MLMKKMLSLMLLLIAGNIAMNWTMNSNMDERLQVLEQKVDKPVTAQVTATMYNAVESQCDKDPLVTAGMYKINPAKATEHKYVALSRNLLKRWGGEFAYGDKVRITGAGDKDGTYTVTDTMNKRYSNRVDILETSGKSGYKYTEVIITKLSC